MEIPSGLTYYTADEVAECLPYGEHLPVEQNAIACAYADEFGED
tara:strand:- start:666 stop:797 length:132 start_codon:yes stop_codon:yes gene_type:complete